MSGSRVQGKERAGASPFVPSAWLRLDAVDLGDEVDLLAATTEGGRLAVGVHLNACPCAGNKHASCIHASMSTRPHIHASMHVGGAFAMLTEKPRART